MTEPIGNGVQFYLNAADLEQPGDHNASGPMLTSLPNRGTCTPQSVGGFQRAVWMKVDQVLTREHRSPRTLSQLNIESAKMRSVTLFRQLSFRMPMRPVLDNQFCVTLEQWRDDNTCGEPHR